ncbi:pirin family protein [Legionella geestiana]|nr:pirin family protein [Legionella geestiana]QBS13409.1 pirin family protein [Legionella geestiana]QDQ41102.1 pirin family protein [Legionella geestiana]
MNQRQVRRLLTGRLMREGAGVKLHRYIGMDPHNEYDPFLLLDFFDSDDPMDYIGGFPDHPHRGFETITYLLHGRLHHRDNHGHEGVLEPGGVQWMTAGRGIIHSEMPRQQSGRLCGIQLWLNLPAAEKRMAPHYHEFSAESFPLEQNKAGVTVKVIAGTTDAGTSSPVARRVTDPVLLDIHLGAGARFVQTLPDTHEAFLFLLQGSFMVIGEKSSQAVHEGILASLGSGGAVSLEGVAPENRCLLIAGRRLNEPVSRLGPFVMNTHEEILEAIDDFRNHRFAPR